MSYYKVIYDKLFPYAPYLNERIGIEILVETSQDPKEALEEARKIVHDFRNKHIQDELVHQTETIPDIQLNKQSLANSLVRDINSCTELKVLESYRLIVKGKPELQTAYDIKHSQLKNSTDGNNL